MLIVRVTRNRNIMNRTALKSSWATWREHSRINSHAWYHLMTGRSSRYRYSRTVVPRTSSRLSTSQQTDQACTLLAKIGNVQKIRENDFDRNLWTFFSLTLRSNEDGGQTIYRTNLKKRKKAYVIFLLPVSKILKIHPYLTVLSSKSYRCVNFGTPCIIKV